MSKNRFIRNSYKISVVGVVNHSDDRYFVKGYILKGIATSGKCADLESVAINIDQGAIGGDHLAIERVAPLQPSLLVADAYPVETT